MLWVAYSVKLTYFYFHAKTGDFFFLKIVYQVIKSFSENALITLFLSIAFGWTVTHLKQVKDTAAPVGGSLCIITLLAIIFSHLLENSSQTHLYDNISLFAILVLRVVVALIFLVGILKSNSETTNTKTKNFLYQFGSLGFAYILSQPLLVFVLGLLLPFEYQNEAITVATDLVHLLVVLVVTNSVLSFNSSYARLDFNHNTVFRSYDPLKQF